jgi:hypothetical protein
LWKINERSETERERWQPKKIESMIESEKVEEREREKEKGKRVRENKRVR